MGRRTLRGYSVYVRFFVPMGLLGYNNWRDPPDKEGFRLEKTRERSPKLFGMLADHDIDVDVVPWSGRFDQLPRHGEQVIILITPSLSVYLGDDFHGFTRWCNEFRHLLFFDNDVLVGIDGELISGDCTDRIYQFLEGLLRRVPTRKKT